MIKTKPKKCKGLGKAVQYGCGVETKYRKYGLCNKCLGEYLLSDPKKIERAIEKAKRVKEETDRKIKRERKVELMSTTAYWSKMVQPVFNEIARLIDKGWPCIASGKQTDYPHGGHYISVGANRTLSLNLHNIHLQSLDSNHFRSGDGIKYREGLINRYGEQYVQFVESLKKCPNLNLSKKDLIEIRERAMKVRNGLKNSPPFKEAESLLAARNIVNDQLMIYTEEYSVFKG